MAAISLKMLVFLRGKQGRAARFARALSRRPRLRHKRQSIWPQVQFVRARSTNKPGDPVAGFLLRELEWNDARNGSNNLTAAPPRHRPHARIDPRALYFAHAAPQRPSTARGPRACRAAARLGGNFRQGVRAGGERAAGAADALRQMAMAELL